MPEPTDPNALAVSERGKTMDVTWAVVELALKVLIIRGNKVRETVAILREQDIRVSSEQIRGWRDTSFPGRYAELRTEMAPVLSEEVAARAMERAIQTDDVEALYIEAAEKKLEDVSPDKLAASVLALSKAKAENISKAQLLRDRPTEIKKSSDTVELLEVLRRHGVLTQDPRTHEEILEAEVVAEEDAEHEALRDRIKAKLSPPS